MIKVEGLSLEKFINLSVSKGIYLWGIKRISYTTLTAKVSIRGFRKLKQVLRKVHCRVTIVEKRGLPFLTYRLKKRKMLVAGMFVCLAILFGISSFIWQVEVEGAEKIDPALIIQYLQKNGISPGTWKGDIHIPDIENQMMIDMPQLSWIGIEIRGIKAIVKVVEAVNPPEIVDKDTPCNVVAAKEGIIYKLTVLEGKPVVDIGDTVRKGQLIVSGVIEHEGIGSRFVHARAEVLARIWYEGVGEVSMKNPLKVRTGRKAVRKYMKMNSWVMTIHEEAIPFTLYEKEVKEEPLFGENLFLPLVMVVEEYYEVQQKEERLKMDELQKIAQEKALQEVERIIPKDAKVVDKRVKFSMIKGESIKAVMYVETLESIGQQVYLSVNKEEQRIEQPDAGKKN